MALDNPSYFTVPSDEKNKSNSCVTVLKRRRMGNSESVSSASDGSLTVPKYIRSISTNSADSNQELLIQGEPRLSDMAPDLAFKHPASRSNSLKEKEAKIPHPEIQYAPVPTSEEDAKDEDLSGDEVFLSEDSARYYNVQAMKASQRRHSIGTFVTGGTTKERERANSLASNFREEFQPQNTVKEMHRSVIDEHALRHGSYPRKRCTRCTSKVASRIKNMDDILIVSLKTSEAASLWVDYFSNYFQQISKHANRKPFKIQHLGVEEAISNGEPNFLEKSTSVKLQLIVLCPSFLEFVSGNPEECKILGKILLSDRTLALLLGVHDSDLQEVHKNALATYSQWQRQSVGQDQDSNFTKEFLSQAMAILSRVWKQQSSVVSQEKAQFTVTPKKIRQGQNSVFILLTYPLQKEDIVRISVEKNGEMYEMKSVKRRNPYILKISVPENLTDVTAIVNVLVEKNGNIIGSRPIKCESKLRELEQILRAVGNPIEFMCQTLGFAPSDREQLDTWLTQNFLRNLPPHFSLLASHESPLNAAMQVHKQSHEEFPTLLHFAARFGLEKLTMQLLDCPGADVANEIRNVHDMTTFEIAQANGHEGLAAVLRGYMSMSELHIVYSKLKAISLNPGTPEVDEEGYLTPREITGHHYKTCPKPRPLETPFTPVSPSTPPLGYITMNTPVDRKKGAIKRDPSPQPGPSKKVLSKSKQELVIEDKVQKELAEIINDFKNNVHSIAQVEKLVDEWKNRNDVQKSFKEKQEQLLEMRLKYEQIQHEIKQSSKKASPFDRIKKFFRPKPDEKKTTDDMLVVPQLITSPQHQRPISSLSTSSSGSSGRMSTISGSSLVDSGTHSDSEERKYLMGTPNEDEFRNDLHKAILHLNYTPLPAPKPVKEVRHLFEAIQELRDVKRPDHLPIVDEFYKQFKPSDMPLAGFSEENEHITPGNGNNSSYMNLSANGEPLNDHTYMNFKISTSR